MTTTGVPATTPRPLAVKLVVPVLAGAAVAVALGVYGGVHEPATQKNPYTLFFTNTLQLKAWFATLVLIFAVLQILTALRIYGKIKVPRSEPSWLGSFHRLSGTLAFGFSLPVAYQCLWSLGFQSTDMPGADSIRVLLHSVAGCFFYGAIVTKVFFVRERGLPGWALPLAGGAVFAVFVLIWLTSALYFFTDRDYFGNGPLF